jgi:nucleotide-binding universal stress UspA family protein
VSSDVLHHATRSVCVVPHASVAGGGPALIAYDGSPDAKLAIERAGALCATREAVVLNVGRHLQPALAYPSPGLFLAREDEELDALTRPVAEALAAEGAELARAAGWEAQPLAAPTTRPVWQAILDAAEACDAAVVVLGSRGLGELRATLRGSVSDGAVHHAQRPLLVVRHGVSEAPAPFADWSRP